MAARPRPNSIEYGNSKTTVHCYPRLNVPIHSSKVKLAAAWLCVFGELWVDMWQLVHQWSFLLFWLSLDCFWPLLYQSSHVYQDCTISVPTVYQKQSKDSQNSKNHRWCTNRHMSTQSPPNTQSLHLRPRPPNTQSRIKCMYQVKTSVCID